MHSVQMCTHAILILELLQTKLAGIDKCVGEVHTLNMFDQIALLGSALLADGALKQLCFCVVQGVLLEHISWVI